MWLFKKKKIYRSAGELYLTRFYLFETRWISMFLHKIHLSDYPIPHDHPWAFISMVLFGKYNEFFECGHHEVRRPFVLRRRKAEDLHWIELYRDENDNPKPCWTLFIHFRKVRDWGFVLDDGEWINAKEFLGDLYS